MTCYQDYQRGYYTSLSSDYCTKSWAAGPAVSYSSDDGNSFSTYVSPNHQNLQASTSPQSASQSQWAILRPPDVSEAEINQLRERVKYIAILPQLGAAIVLVDQGYGILQAQKAWWIANNLIFVFNEEDHGAFRCLDARGMMLYKNPVVMFTSAVDSSSKVEFSTTELASFLFTMGEHPSMKMILELDTCYIAADRYILAMAFIYVKKANMPFSSSGDVVYLLASILLAHKLEEDDSYRNLLIVIRQALPEQASELEKDQLLRNIQSIEKYIFIMMDYRAFVTAEECESVIAAAPLHPLWKRRRLGFHAGATRPSYQQWKEEFTAKSCLNFGLFTESQAPCVICQANVVYFDQPRYRSWQEENFDGIKSHLANICNIVRSAHISKVRMSYQYGCGQLQKLLSGLKYDYSSSEVPKTEIECNPPEFVEVLALERQLEYMLSMERYVQQCIMVVQTQKASSNNSYALADHYLTRLA